VLYQLSYSRAIHSLMLAHVGLRGITDANTWRRDGGEGNRTPDLLNAIQALSQLSYAPHKRPVKACRKEPQTIAVGIGSVNERVLAKNGKAGILQRLTAAFR
jgi:hypothetical protein